ncbi:cyclase [Gordonia sp. TBRC 11910]|uniref:Cyclase n=1 Tax=Gordonia asplenii TaxID=2725283 RepID=A0A848L7X3_9ACTN|nr:cyclase [Gordonia asplenii]
MTDKVEFDIDASPELAYATLLDVESLPQWSASHKTAKVIERDASGNPSVVEAEAGLVGITDHLVFNYEFTDLTCKWDTAKEGTAIRSQGGRYVLSPNADGGTHVDVEVYLEPKIKLPGFVLKKGAKMINEIASKGFTKEVLARKANEA